jgi:hydrogenase expression/formation protein HypE
MKQNQYGKEACIIGEVTETRKGKVILKTRLGASRMVDMLTGELLPRIC